MYTPNRRMEFFFLQAGDYHPNYDFCQVKLWEGFLAGFGVEIKVLRVSSTVITVLE